MSINVQYIKLPGGSHGSCVKNEEPDCFTIFLDPNDSQDMQRYGYLHEMEHILSGDFDNISDKDVSQIERIAHLQKYDSIIKGA